MALTQNQAIALGGLSAIGIALLAGAGGGTGGTTPSPTQTTVTAPLGKTGTTIRLNDCGQGKTLVSYDGGWSCVEHGPLATSMSADAGLYVQSVSAGGTITGLSTYGHLYVDGSPASIVLTTAGVAYPWINIPDAGGTQHTAASQGVTTSTVDGSMTVTIEGDYSIDWAVSLTSDTDAYVFIGPYVDGAIQSGCRNSANTFSSGVRSSAAGSCVKHLNAGAVVDLRLNGGFSNMRIVPTLVSFTIKRLN